MKGLIDEFKYGNWNDKKRAKLRKEMLVQSKLEHCSAIGSSEVVDLGFRSALYGWKAKTYA